MIGTIDVKVQAHNPNFPLDPVFTFVNSSQSFRIRDVPKRIGNWSITNVFVNITYPDNTVISKECVLTGGVWVGTVNGCSSSGQVEKGFVVTASGIDENNQTVSNYVLGAGDIYVKQLDGTVTPGKTSIRMFFYETIPTSPNEGDSTFIEGVLNVYDGTQWKPALEVDLTNYYDKDEIDDIIENVEESIPTKTSDLTNDSGFITVNEVPTPDEIEDTNGNIINANRNVTVHSDYGWTLSILDKTLRLEGTKTNSEYIDANTKYTLDFSEGNWNLKSFKWDNINLIWVLDNSSSISGEESDTSLLFYLNMFVSVNLNWEQTNYNDVLALESQVPKKTSQLTNDAGFITISQVPTPDKIQDTEGNIINANRDITKIVYGDYCWNIKPDSSSRETVMTGTKEYSTYTWTSANRTVLEYHDGNWTYSSQRYYNDTWNIMKQQIVSGSTEDTTLRFNDLSITVTWKPLKQEVNATLALTTEIPTKTSDLTNDSGFITSSDVPTKTSDLTNDSGFITSSYPVKNDGGITKAKAMTEQAYEALQTKDSTTLYVITEN